MSKACWTLTKLPFFNPVCFAPKRSTIFVSVLLYVINLFSPFTEIQLSSKVPFGKWTVSGSIRFDNFLLRLIRFELGRPFGWLLQQKLPDKFSCWAIFFKRWTIFFLLLLRPERISPNLFDFTQERFIVPRYWLGHSLTGLLSLSLKINWFRSWLDEEISFMAWLLLNLVWIRDETLYRKFGFPWNLKKFYVGLCPSSFQAVFGWLLVWSWKINKKFYSNDSTQNLNLSIFIVMKRFHRKFF